MQPLLLGWLVVASSALAGSAGQFDPSGYIDHKETQKSKRAETLSSQAIFRINGRRFMKLGSTEGAVYLPSTNSVPDLHFEFAVCQQDLPLMDEVLAVRENMDIDAEIKKHEKTIVGLIRKCIEGRADGPVLSEKQPDGAVIEVQSKKKVPPEKAEETGSNSGLRPH